MFFAIIALGMSAAQILIGIAIGLWLRKLRQRQAAGNEALRTSPGPIAPPVAEQVADNPRSTGRGVVTGAGDPASGTSCAASATAKKAGEASGGKRANEAPALPAGNDRRISSRQCFEFRQNVAPYFGGLLPGKASFREVECHDISSTGFSFLSTQLPDFEAIVVALGVAPHLVYLQAQIVNRFPLDDGPAPLYRIGCRFVGQLNAAAHTLAR